MQRGRGPQGRRGASAVDSQEGATEIDLRPDGLQGHLVLLEAGLDVL